MSSAAKAKKQASKNAAVASKRTCSLFVGSMNAGNAPPSIDLSPWIPKHGGGFDIIAIGMQEASYSGDAPEEPANEDNVKEIHKKKAAKRKSKIGAAFLGVGAVAIAATGVGAIALAAGAAGVGATYGIAKYMHSKDHFIGRYTQHTACRVQIWCNRTLFLQGHKACG